MVFNQQGLAWNEETGDRKRLRRIVSSVIPVFLLMVVSITWTDLPEQEREELEALPPQLAKVILKKKEKLKPIIKKVEKKLEEKIIKPEKRIVEKPKPKLKPLPKIVKKSKVKPKATKNDIQLARKKAKSSGLLAMNSQLSAISSLAKSVKLDTPKTLTAKPISRKVTDRLASKVSTAKSVGVVSSDLNQETHKISLASRETTEVQQADEIANDIQIAELEARKVAVQRSREELRRTMDANKSAIDSIYRRALRKKPSLQGVFTAQLVIETDGQVSSCASTESTLNSPTLESKICKRLRLVNFGQKQGVEPVTFNYPIEFIPS